MALAAPHQCQAETVTRYVDHGLKNPMPGFLALDRFQTDSNETVDTLYRSLLTVSAVGCYMAALETSDKCHSLFNCTNIAHDDQPNYCTMADTQYMPNSIALDATWDHAMLSDEDAMWLQQQQEHDLAHEWLSDFPTAQDIQATEDCYDEDESTASPRNVDFMLQHHYDHEEPERDAYEEYFANIDTTNMSKAELRKHKNRASAARSRQRTRERMEQLERLVCELAAKNRHIEQTLNAMHFHQLAMAGAHPGVITVPHGFPPTSVNHEMM